VIERSLLSADTAVQQRASQQEARLRAAVEEALTPGGKSRRYTFADLKAVQLATPIYRELRARGEPCEVAATQMRACLNHLAIGCHRYDRREKTAAYRAARNAASLAAMELWLLSSEPNDPLRNTIENELLGTLGGLLRRNERGGGSE